jgi:hypothetical protein
MLQEYTPRVSIHAECYTYLRGRLLMWHVNRNQSTWNRASLNAQLWNARDEDATPFPAIIHETGSVSSRKRIFQEQLGGPSILLTERGGRHLSRRNYTIYTGGGWWYLPQDVFLERSPLVTGLAWLFFLYKTKVLRPLDDDGASFFANSLPILYRTLLISTSSERWKWRWMCEVRFVNNNHPPSHTSGLLILLFVYLVSTP